MPPNVYPCEGMSDLEVSLELGKEITKSYAGNYYGYYNVKFLYQKLTKKDKILT